MVMIHDRYLALKLTIVILSCTRLLLLLLLLLLLFPVVSADLWLKPGYEYSPHRTSYP